MRFLSTISLLFIAICVLQQGDAVKRFRNTHWSRINEILNAKFPATPAAITDQWITQKLEHYDVTNAQTWQQVRR